MWLTYHLSIYFHQIFLQKKTRRILLDQMYNLKLEKKRHTKYVLQTHKILVIMPNANTTHFLKPVAWIVYL